MQVLIQGIIDTCLMLIVVSIFFFTYIWIKNKLKAGLEYIGAELAIGAFLIQIVLFISFFLGIGIKGLQTNITVGVLFVFLWVLCIWLATKKNVLTKILSYQIGISALMVSVNYTLGWFSPINLVLIFLYSFFFSIITYHLVHHLIKIRSESDFEKLFKDPGNYKIKCYQKEPGAEIEDLPKANYPLQPVIDKIGYAMVKSDYMLAISGIRKIPALCSEMMVKGIRDEQIIEQLNADLYQLAIIVEDENRNLILIDLIDTFALICKLCLRNNMQNAALHTIETMCIFCEELKKGDVLKKPCKLSIIKNARNLSDIYNIASKHVTVSPEHKLAAVSCDILTTSLKDNMPEPAEKSIMLLKRIAIDASIKSDMVTLDTVSELVPEMAKCLEMESTEHLKITMIHTLREIGLKSVQESNDLKRYDCLDKVIVAFEETGKIFGQEHINEITEALKDIGVAAAKRHSDKKVSRIVPAIEHFCKVLATGRNEEGIPHAISTIVEVCEASIKEQMVESTAISSKSLANLSNIEPLSVTVNDAMYKLGKYREIDKEMFALFDKTYRKYGGK